MNHLRNQNHFHQAAPRRFDEVIYTPFTFNPILGELSEQQARIPDYVPGVDVTDSNVNLHAENAESIFLNNKISQSKILILREDLFLEIYRTGTWQKG